MTCICLPGRLIMWHLKQYSPPMSRWDWTTVRGLCEEGQKHCLQEVLRNLEIEGECLSNSFKIDPKNVTSLPDSRSIQSNYLNNTHKLSHHCTVFCIVKHNLVIFSHLWGSSMFAFSDSRPNLKK